MLISPVGHTVAEINLCSDKVKKNLWYTLFTSVSEKVLSWQWVLVIVQYMDQLWPHLWSLWSLGDKLVFRIWSCYLSLAIQVAFGRIIFSMADNEISVLWQTTILS